MSACSRVTAKGPGILDGLSAQEQSSAQVSSTGSQEEPSPHRAETSEGPVFSAQGR